MGISWPLEADSGRFGKADSGRFLHSGIREQPTEGRFGGSELIRGFGDAEGVPTGSTEGCFTHTYDDFSHLLLSLFRTTEPCEELLTDSPKVSFPYVGIYKVPSRIKQRVIQAPVIFGTFGMSSF